MYLGESQDWTGDRSVLTSGRTQVTTSFSAPLSLQWMNVLKLTLAAHKEKSE